MRLIETNHLEVWAKSKSAEGDFPLWVKRLICAVIKPTKIRFPVGPAIWLPGYDGVVTNNDTDNPNDFVPLGQSVWEVGTRSDSKKQARENYDKRSKNPLGVDTSDTAFVFVTPWPWSETDKKDWVNWANGRKKKRIWKDVKLVDGVDLCEWFEQAASSTLQFAAELRVAPNIGLYPPDQAWDEWSQLSNPSVSEDLVLVGRDDQAKELIQRLREEPSTFTVRGDSPREAWGFVLAAIRRFDLLEERMGFTARMIVANDEKVAGELTTRKNLIIVLKEAKGQVSGSLSSGTCHIIIPEGTDIRSNKNFIVLPRPDYYSFAEVLQRTGFAPEGPEKIARDCGRSVTVLQRLYPDSNFERPRWAEEDGAKQLIPALLAGRWNSEIEGDREIIAHLAETQDYPTAEAQFQRFLWVNEAPLQKIDEMWTLSAPVDAFQLIARHLTTSHLERFKKALVSVFGQLDPKVEIPPEQWLYHDFENQPKYSPWLRKCMADTLLLIVDRGKDANLTCLASPEKYAAEVMRALPGLGHDWRIFASISDQAARLMEAAPVPFLESFESLLQEHAADIPRLFTEGGGFGTQSFHTGLLWGLETLAWSPHYFPRAALILAKLAALDPGGKLYNRPINSLREIFLWWHPGTNASFGEQLTVLDTILSEEPLVGWELLTMLLPETSSYAHPTHRPRWRNFGDFSKEIRTRDGQIEYVSGIVERTLCAAGSSPERWQVVLRSLEAIGAAQRRKAIALLDQVIGRETNLSLKKEFWQILRDFIHKQRTFSDADWSLKDQDLDRLEAVLAQVVPDDPVESNKWLFDAPLPRLTSGESKLGDEKTAVNARRQMALGQIFEKKGTAGLVKLAISCKFPVPVVIGTIPDMIDWNAIPVFLEEAINSGEAGVRLATDISWRAEQVWGTRWRKFVLKLAQCERWTPVTVAALLLSWPNDRTTWKQAKRLGTEVEVEYWRRKPILFFEGTSQDVAYEIKLLIAAGRAARVLDCIALDASAVPSRILLQVFDATFNELSKAETQEDVLRLGLNSYDMSKFLAQLRQRKDLPRKAVALREYKALPLLDSRKLKGLTIYDFMAADPIFFVDVLCSVFLPAHRDKSQEPEPDLKEQVQAKAGWSLLEGMHRIPGETESGEIQEDKLLQWIQAVRLEAEKKDRSVIADQYIGKILAHAPEDPEDGGWPIRVVRNILQRLASEHIEIGLRVERRNMRGVYSKKLYEGGAKERALAEKYKDWAALSGTGWQRMARVLNAIAESYEEDARREDARAEQDKMD